MSEKEEKQEAPWVCAICGFKAYTESDKMLHEAESLHNTWKTKIKMDDERVHRTLKGIMLHLIDFFGAERIKTVITEIEEEEEN